MGISHCNPSLTEVPLCRPRPQGQTLSSITKNLQTYAISKNLMQYDNKTRALVQALVIFKQQHVSDRLLYFIQNCMDRERGEMVADLGRVDLQEFDQVCHDALYRFRSAGQNANGVGQLSKSRIRSKQNSRSVQLTKLSSKYIQQGQHQIRSKKFLFIIPIDCFNSYNYQNSSLQEKIHMNLNMHSPFQKTDLISRKSRIQIFEQKLQALKQRYDCNFQVYFICRKGQKQNVQSQIKKNTKNTSSKLQYAETSQTSPFFCQTPRSSTNNSNIFNINYTILQYQSDQPCINSEGKIVLYGNRIKFNETDGDLVRFLFKNPVIRNSQNGTHKFDYVVFHDINNLVSPALNPAHIGLLCSNTKVQILATARNPTKIPNCTLPINSQFIQIQPPYIPSDIIIKSQLLSPQHHLSSLQILQSLNTRITLKPTHPQTTHQFYLHRMPQDILHASITQVAKMPYQAQNCYQYSNFCKKALDICNENEADVLEIGMDVVHGGGGLEKIKSMLRSKEGQLGYPIVIVKSLDGDQVTVGDNKFNEDFSI